MTYFSEGPWLIVGFAIAIVCVILILYCCGKCGKSERQGQNGVTQPNQSQQGLEGEPADAEVHSRAGHVQVPTVNDRPTAPTDPEDDDDLPPSYEEATRESS